MPDSPNRGLIDELIQRVSPEDYATLQRYLGAPRGQWAPGLDLFDNYPSVPNHAPPFRPPTDVVNPQLSANLEQLYRAFPEMRGKAASVQGAPTPGVFRDLRRSGIPESKFENTNLMGLTNLYGPRQVYVNPGMGATDTASTLWHEMTHANGFNENAAKQVNDIYEKAAMSKSKDDSAARIKAFEDKLRSLGVKISVE